MKLDTLDRNFSKYIRIRDSENGIVKCISCGKFVPINEADCGHFVNRRNMSLRFNEKNCNAQCRKCNRFDEGNAAGYALGLIQKYGQGIIEELNVLKAKHVKYSQFEIDTLNKYYLQKIKEMSNLAKK